MIEIIQAVVLGVVQGLAEFIPISSSGHLVLVPELLGFPAGGLSFDVALHLGTMLAVVTYLRRELLAIARSVAGVSRDPESRRYRTLAVFAIAGTVPVGLVGLALGDVFERIFATPAVAAVALVVTGLLLLAGERARDRRVRTRVPAGAAVAPPRSAFGLPLGTDPDDPSGDDLSTMTLRQALLIGLAQCLALLPGISRSGTTIVAGMGSGLTREAATRFSFLLGLPAMLGAVVLEVPEVGADGVYGGPAIVAGVIASFVSGYLAIRWLIRVVSTERLTGFAVYCIAAGLGAMVLLTVV